jgi:hypothetical protein
MLASGRTRSAVRDAKVPNHGRVMEIEKAACVAAFFVFTLYL